MTPQRDQYDCVVVGGGPAGATAAARVAQAGHSVLLLERDQHPRPHVGESLMPESYWVFERLGVLSKLNKSAYSRKVGVQFVNHTGRESQPFFFRNHDPRDCSETWHVDRAEFDQMLFEHARELGAECVEQARVTAVAFEGDRAVGVKLKASGGDRSVACKVVVDASGQQSLIANKLGLKRVDPKLKKAAIWRHYRGAERDESGGGVKTIIAHTNDKRAWFWYIPQANDTVSVGVVADSDYLLKGGLTAEQAFDAEVAKCDSVRRWIENAEAAPDLRVAREFSYSTDRAAGDGWVLVGDAWGFIDPVYSSGVYFALKSADMAADAVIDALRHDDLSAERLGAWAPEFTAGTKWVRKLVHAFYSGEFRVGKFVMEHPQHSGPLTDLLIGRMFSPEVPQMFEDLEPWLERMIATAGEGAIDDDAAEDSAPSFG
ncbi:Putative FAD-dependent oxidoreductase LodB [Pirellulimonas nuda]|uniref:FAD-dependent oxidoreductase LodB n=1 Tax=Pirellulimonas nuda TaxID=2528009 RepID=A0A518D9J4_9BACT|nr:NAD(P)/FAD-dependent oxidoreductase [Pirellulimonas nuda]QDU88108.1 Putative FAD-dependent oxidoreductase LodB [Pirellulimonas nuda]